MSEDSPTKAEELIEARGLLDTGNPQAAFTLLRKYIDWPASFDSREDWSSTWILFGEIARAIVGVELADVVEAAAENPTDVRALYDLGYELVEVGLPLAAATPLARADEFAPGNEPIVSELVHALEVSGLHQAAVMILRSNAEMVEESFTLQYLLAFNLIMSAEVNEARESYDKLVPDGDEQEFMQNRLRLFLTRAEGIKRIAALNTKDLRGWHFVINGAILLHLSPYGLDSPMHGRYAFVQDSEELCRQGCERIIELLKFWEISPERVFYLHDRGSEILARTVAELAGIEALPWPMDGTDEEGLIVSYDLSYAADPELEALYNRRPRQILWSHACCWTEVPPYAADAHTFMYQHNVEPWGERLTFGEEDDQVIRGEADHSPIPDWVDKLMAVDGNEDYLDDMDEVRALAKFSAELPDFAKPTALRPFASHRPRFWDSSPVSSNKFS